MTTTDLRHAVLLLGVSLFSAAAQAQFPSDNDAWKARCLFLTSLDAQVVAGTEPQSLVASTRGIAGEKFATLGFNRGLASQHYVACTLFYLSAISARAGNGAKPDPDRALSYTILAQDELKYARRQKLKLSQRLKRDEIKIELAGKTNELNSEETAAVMQASDTTPVTLTK